MVNEGDMVPAVTLQGLEQEPVSPADFSGHKLVLYFYPKDDTSRVQPEVSCFG